MSKKEKLDINSATIEELEKTPWIGKSRARAIVALRKANGPINDINEIMQIEGISQYDFNFMKLFITCPLKQKYDRASSKITDKKAESESETIRENVVEDKKIDNVSETIDQALKEVNETGDLKSKQNNTMALTGFILGIVSFFFGSLIIILPIVGIVFILGIVFSGIGLGTFNPVTQKNKWMAWWGLVLNILSFYLAITSIIRLINNS